MQNYEGKCHCGAVRFTLQSEPIERGLRCNCSICTRKGALMSSAIYAPDALQIFAEDDALACYRFGSGVAQHFFCRHCGIYPFHQTVRKPGYYRVNLGCLEGVDATALPFDLFDGRALPVHE